MIIKHQKYKINEMPTKFIILSSLFLPGAFFNHVFNVSHWVIGHIIESSMLPSLRINDWTLIRWIEYNNDNEMLRNILIVL